MKNIFLIAFITLFSCISKPQYSIWNTDPGNTDFVINQSDRIVSYTDGNGIHCLINRSGIIKYVRFNTNRNKNLEQN